ncbi:hypothetical protein L345_06913, partial [Ophiophagus hannah]
MKKSGKETVYWTGSGKEKKQDCHLLAKVGTYKKEYFELTKLNKKYFVLRTTEPDVIRAELSEEMLTSCNRLAGLFICSSGKLLVSLIVLRGINKEERRDKEKMAFDQHVVLQSSVRCEPAVNICFDNSWNKWSGLCDIRITMLPIQSLQI